MDRTNERRYERRMDGWMEREIRWTDKLVDEGLMDSWKKRTKGRKDGCMDGRTMDGR